MAFEKLVPRAGNFTSPDRVALAVVVTASGIGKLRCVLGAAVAKRLGLAVKEKAQVEFDRFASQLRISKGSDWRCSQWSGGVVIGLCDPELGVPAVKHRVSQVRSAFDQEGRLIVTLPLWAQPPKATK